MTISIELPADIERSLRHQDGDVGHIIKEAALVELYRQEKITLRDLSQAFGITRLEAEGILKRHNFVDDFAGDEEIERALKHLGIG